MPGTMAFGCVSLANNPGPCPLPPNNVELWQTHTSVITFRHMFPEFADSSVYLDEIVNVWLAIAPLNPLRWGQFYNMGVGLFVAHQLALGRQAQLQAARGGVPGITAGMVASKSINGASISYNGSAASLQGGGDYNLTSYGIRFLNLARMIGSGGFQIMGQDQMLIREADLMTGNLPNFGFQSN